MKSMVRGRRPEPPPPADYPRIVDDTRADGRPEPLPSRKRRPRKSTETLKAELLNAAATVFARRGYSGASIKDIADLAGTPQASIYRHYGSKADLFVAAVADPFIELIADYTATLQDQFTHSSDPYHLTETHIANLYDHLYDRRTAVLALICASGDPEAQKPVQLVVQRLNEMFETFQTVSVQVWERGGGYEIEHAALWHRLVAGMVVAATALEPLFLPDGWYKPTRNEVIGVMSAMVTNGIFDRTTQNSRPGQPQKPD
ncbi:transcriptional regulator, TetR family [Mycolicibacterium rhodesiae JS60]|nr:transcriptional regulator, TetR family [Mycolicibacterium rhodesiae JS60]